MTVVGSGALVCVRLDQSDSAGSALVCACVCLCFVAISCVSDHDTVVSQHRITCVTVTNHLPIV